MKKQIVCFDLEGPLSPQDLAFELVSSTKAGAELFRAISRYDDILTLEDRTGYEPGDTLALILPFLLWQGLTAAAITTFSRLATLTPGATELVQQCVKKGREVYVVSTAYYPHVLRISQMLDLPPENIIATQIPTQSWAGSLAPEAEAIIADAAAYMRQHFLGDDLDRGDRDEDLVRYLDALYLERLPEVGVVALAGPVTPMGGRRKVWAVERIARQHQVYLEDLVFIGDSITDAAVLRVIDVAGGLAISFNGNAFAIPHATVAVASTSLLSLAPILDAWSSGGRAAVKAAMDGGAGVSCEHYTADYAWTPRTEARRLEATILRHAKVRLQVREAAARLG